MKMRKNFSIQRRNPAWNFFTVTEKSSKKKFIHHVSDHGSCLLKSQNPSNFV